MAERIITLKEACEQGASRYFTGKACKRGHMSPRFVANQTCIECQKEIDWTRRGITQQKADNRRNAIAARALARERGLLHYRVETPCKRGHVAERLTINGQCLRCSAENGRTRYWKDPQEARRKAREFVAENADRVNELKRASYARDPQKHRERSKRFVLENYVKVRTKANERYLEQRDVLVEKARQYRIANRNAVNERNLKRYFEQDGRQKQAERRAANLDAFRKRDRAWRAKNRTKVREAYRRWWDRDPEKAKRIYVALVHKRRARKLQVGGTHTAADLAAILKAQGHRCIYCRVDLRKVKRHVDHIQPLARGGSNDKTNLQYLCQPCNAAKGARDPVEFAQEQGLLL